MPIRHKEKGFTLTEALVATSVLIVLSSVAVIGIQAALKALRVRTAYDYTLTQLRVAHDRAISDRSVFLVQFVSPQTINTVRIRHGVREPIASLQLPSDISFQIVSGIPTGAANTPDNFGTGVTPIDFSVNYSGGGTEVYFQPDGTAKDIAGRTNNGIVYLGRSGELSSARAVTVFGGTGRIKGWQLKVVGGTPRWQ